MFPDAFIPLGQVPATASRLERAAGELRESAGSPSAVPSLPQTLTHLEDAFGDLAAAMRQLAQATAEWYDTDHPGGQEPDLPPEAHALLWHLRADADALSKLRAGIAGSREWAQQLLEEAATEPDPGVVTNLPHAQDLRLRRIVCGVDGSDQPATPRAPHCVSPSGSVRDSGSCT